MCQYKQVNKIQVCIIKMSKSQPLLGQQILIKCSLLLDKPISTNSTKSLLLFLQKQQCPKQRLLNLSLSKYRNDLILVILQNYSYLIQSEVKFNKLINNFVDNVMEYDQLKLIQMWNLTVRTFAKSQNTNTQEKQLVVYKTIYEDLLKIAIKTTNLEKKNRYFGLIQNNIHIFLQFGYKDSLRKVTATYIEVFKKFSIPVPNYAKVLASILDTIRKSNQMNLENNCQQLKFVSLPEINGQYMIILCSQIKNLILSTKQKPLHLLHNQCLITLSKLLCCKQIKANLTIQLLHQYNKTIDTFLYRKGTRQQARKINVILNNKQKQIRTQNQEKMIKYYADKSELNQSNLPMIGNVIDRTNKFLAKYQIKNQQQIQLNNYDPIMRNSRYLKKGNGIGGGKTTLQIQLNNKKNPKQILNQKPSEKKNKFDLLLQNCLQRCQSQNHPANPFRKSHISSQIPYKGQTRLSKQVHSNIINKTFSQAQSQSQYYPDPINYKQERNQYAKQERSNNSNECFQNDEEINQINELIDLAYSYKFSID